ncbi:MAG: NAD+ synthase [Alphaproteobacteria bacterium]|nr:NAD+ synthase [Alphaproteobacteria bacterium]
MSDRLSIALAQIDPTVGDVEGNARKIRAARAAAALEGADIVVFPELTLSGYPPEDLVLAPMFQDALRRAAEALAAETSDGGPALLVGAPWKVDGRLYNAALVLESGRIAAVRLKHDLPNYGVFDERRVFAAGAMPGPVMFRGVRLGIMVCEDMWTPDAAETLQESGAEILVVPNGSPYESDKVEERVQLAVARVTETGLPLVYVNQVGGQDELVFDGASFVLGADCALRAQLPAFAEAVSVTRWARGADGTWACVAGETTAPPTGAECVYRALVLGLRDYVGKNGFPGVVLGMSGGIDSALSAAIAVDALGAERVRCVMMPSPYTARDSLEDAAECAALLGASLATISIEPAMAAFAHMLAPEIGDRAADATEENIQARARGMALMALSNKLGPMVLSTGNKSEMSVGYATLYGDMCGGYAMLKDVYKTAVYALADWRNRAVPPGGLGPAGRVIPARILAKAPTAELKPGQTDQDSLPPYPVLDDILACLVEGEMPVADIAARGHDPAVVGRVRQMLDRAEYKRRQAPPGVKITRRAFGRERRYPITNGFRG